MWFVLSVFLIFLPGRIYRLNKYIIHFIGKLLGRISYGVKNILPKRNRRAKVSGLRVEDYGQYEDRHFDMWDRNGNLVYPTDDEVLGKYINANNNYPEIGSQRYHKARKLDIPYFFSKKYEFDYIVLGDRAQLEEARKGSSLTGIEENLIVLGYGYDGKPFGYHWGIAKRCLNDYLFAEEHGELLTWGVEHGYYEKYVLDGYQPPYKHDPNINNSIQFLAHRSSKQYIKTGFQSINKEVLDDFTAGNIESVLKKSYQSKNLEYQTDSILKLNKKTSTH